MQIKDYFPKDYLKDQETYLEEIGEHICGRFLSTIFKDNKYSKFINLEYFFIIQYELNLLNQLVHTYFKSDIDLWNSITIQKIGCQCSYISHPLEILRHTQIESKNSDHPIIFSRENVLKFDIYFKEYLEDICKKNKFNELTPEKLFETLKNDPDCNNDYVKIFFINLKQ